MAEEAEEQIRVLEEAIVKEKDMIASLKKGSLTDQQQQQQQQQQGISDDGGDSVVKEEGFIQTENPVEKKKKAGSDQKTNQQEVDFNEINNTTPSPTHRPKKRANASHSLYEDEQALRGQVKDYLDDKTSYPPTPGTEPVTPEPPTVRRKEQLKLQDVLSHHPMEDEAETYVQDCIEENEHEENRFNSNNKGLKEVRQTILGSVPDEAKGIFRQPSEANNSEQQQGRRTSNATLVSAAAAFSGAAASGRHKKAAVATRHKKNKPSTAETLLVLADQMEDMQDQKASLSSLASARRRRASEEEQQRQQQQHHDEPVSQGDILARNAAILLRRKQKERMKKKKEERKQNEGKGAAVENSPTEIETTTASKDAASKWKKLKFAVQTVGALEDAKKTDRECMSDEEVVDIEAGGTSLEDSMEQDGSTSTTESHQHNNRKHRKHRGVQYGTRSYFLDLYDWMKFRSKQLLGIVKVFLFIILLATGIATLLFYGLENPPCGTRTDCMVHVNTTNPNPFIRFFIDEHGIGASYSWWMLFIVRQCITLSLSIFFSAWFIDFLCLKTKYVTTVLGPFGTLFLVQAKGWPFTLFVWGVLDFAMLYGKHKFAHHWLFWQNAIAMCNDQNPSGTITHNGGYAMLLSVFLVLGTAVAIKRFWIGLVFGKKMYSRYAQDLAKLMKKALLVGEVASLARDIEMERFLLSDFGLDREAYASKFDDDDCSSDENMLLTKKQQPNKKHRRSLSRGGARQSIALDVHDMTHSARNARIDEMLDEWEEPDAEHGKIEKVDIASIIQFRHSLSYLGSSFPFGVAFGAAESRVESVAAVEHIYHQLLESTPQRSILTFDTLALLALRGDGTLDENKVSDLIHAFRPDREGNLSLLDFAKSVDSVYKELRMLRASVATTSRMNHAFEIVINIIFYFLVGCVIVAILGKNPLTVLASITAPIVGFSFMIGAASSKYFEGVMFILLQRPYDIGDRINVSSVNVDTSGGGSPGWIVKDVQLYHTTCVLGSTNEVCTYSNGALASSRIINQGRSPQAVINFLIKFPIDVPYNKIKIFKAALGKFIKARPREWILFSAFRPTRVESDQGFVEYVLYAKHREHWQQIGAVLDSKADLFSFALELQKKMNIRYHSPRLPVDLKVTPQAIQTLMGDVPPTSSDPVNADTKQFEINNDSFSSLEAMFAAAEE